MWGLPLYHWYHYSDIFLPDPGLGRASYMYYKWYMNSWYSLCSENVVKNLKNAKIWYIVGRKWLWIVDKDPGIVLVYLCDKYIPYVYSKRLPTILEGRSCRKNFLRKWTTRKMTIHITLGTDPTDLYSWYDVYTSKEMLEIIFTSLYT